jgi:hypothetical protein
MHGASINKTAFSATLHCLTGCAIGEILGLVIGTAFNLSNFATLLLATVLAFTFGYGLSLLPVLKAGVAFTAALGIVLASDTLSILTMEVVDNLVVLVFPGAMNAGLGDVLFWFSLVIALFIAFWAAFPINRYLLQRGKGHALLHQYHHNNG